MARKGKKEEEKAGGLPPWMATYSDMVTLLLTFFVLLLSMASFEDPARIQLVYESIQKAFGIDGVESLRLGTDNQPQNTTEPVREDTTIQPIEVQLREAMAEHISDNLVQMVKNEEEIRLRLDDRILFKPGSAVLHPAAYGILADIANLLKDKEVDIRVEAHTDASGQEEANWELSGLRAIEVVRSLRLKGPVPGKRLEAVAMGSFRPATLFEGDAAWNRRVELVLRSDDQSIQDTVLDVNSPGPR